MAITYFEDIRVGGVDRYGAHVVDRDEVIAFARRYDPQPFHLDDAAAAANPLFERVAASGWHTAAMAMRLTVDRGEEIGLQVLGGAGLDELRWLKPVYPGDTLRVEAEVLEMRPSGSRPRIGLVKTRVIVFNQHDEPVMRHVANVVVARRP